MNIYTIDKIDSVEVGVERIFKARELTLPTYTLKRRGDGELADILVFDGKELPFVAEVYDPRIRSVSDYGRKTSENSALNVYSFVGCDSTLEEHIYRELAIAEFILHSKIEKITAFVNKSAANIIVLMEDKTTANLDLGNTLAEGSTRQCQHRLITAHGMANDIAVGTVTAVNQVNVFKTESRLAETYDDDEYYLYGLSELDTARAVACYMMMRGIRDISELEASHQRRLAALKAVILSSKEERPVFINELL